MNKPDVHRDAQSAAHAQDHEAAKKQRPTGSSSKPALAPKAEPNSETVSMGSPAFGLGGRPVPKDAIHNNS